MTTVSATVSTMPSDRIIRIAHYTLIVLASAAFLSAVVPEVRAGVRGTLLKDFRSVVSTVTGDLSGDGRIFTVAKVKTRNNIYLEIFTTVANTSTDTLVDGHSETIEAAAPQLVERIEIPDSRDAFFSFNGQASNLAIDDVDGDGRKEILVPTFDRNLVGRLNVFQYNDSTRGFSRLIR